MIMKNYAGFIKDNHLKIDTNVELFKNDCCNTVTVKKMSVLKKA
jgi:integrase